MHYMNKIRTRKFCGLVELKRGVIFITVVSLLNKLSGFFGIPAIFYGGGIISIASFIYSIVTSIAFTYFLYEGVLKEDPKKLQIYSLFYWGDLIINILFSFTFEMLWYFKMNHVPLRPSDNNENNDNNTISTEGNSTTPAWKVESTIANLILAAVTIAHIYFTFVVHTYAHCVVKSRHSNNSSSIHSSPRISTSNLALLKSENGSSSRHTTVEDDLESQE
ncbi:hypothetical protein Glove_42g40 [Diversispora epigaea]|uniref:Uncharacterized protein n=1 Tax=Diversispora epigaea TaxID=1348612 RepID=A0A397JJF8_9GLOM|nr:hypothetical protein Glove_42g40 [Diversispora epigaea]